MARIPREHHAEILRRAGQGQSAAQIATWLETATPAAKVSDRSIRKLLEKTRSERADATKVVVRDTLGPVVTTDLDELEQARQRARAIEDAAMKPVPGSDGDETPRNPELALKALKLQSEILDKKLHYSGADAPDAPEPHTTVGVVVLPPESDE